MDNKQTKTFGERFGIRGGMQGLEYTGEQSRDKFLELDIKLPEFFTFLSSIFIAYLSTITQTNIAFFLSIVCFSVIALLSLITLWKLKQIHLQTATRVKDTLAAFRELEKKYTGKLSSPDSLILYKEELKVLEKERRETYEVIGQTRKIIEFLLLLKFALFITGLFLIIFSQILWQIILMSGAWKSIISYLIFLALPVLAIIFAYKKFFAKPKSK